MIAILDNEGIFLNDWSIIFVICSDGDEIKIAFISSETFLRTIAGELVLHELTAQSPADLLRPVGRKGVHNYCFVCNHPYRTYATLDLFLFISSNDDC